MPDLPRNLNLDENTKGKLVSYLNEQLLNHRAERGDFLAQLMEWQKIYWAKPSTTKKTFPFDGACNIIVPLSAIAIETVHSRNMTTLMALPETVTCKATNKLWSDVEDGFNNWFNRILKNKVNIYDFYNNTSLENVKFGNCIGRSSYERLERKAIREIDGKEEEISVTVKDTATADAVPLARFLMPYAYTDPQKSPWVGEEHEEGEYQIKLLEGNGFFIKGTRDKLDAWVNQQNQNIQGATQVENNQRRLEDKVAVWPKTINWVELWLCFNTDEDPDGLQKEIVVHYHQESQTIMSLRYNWYDDLRRPYRIGKYFPIEHRWTAVGICKQNDEFQKEVTIQHRQRIDNATLANTRMFKVNRLSGYGPGEPIFPGKMWFVDEMDHIDSVQFGDVYTSSFNNEQATLIYSQQRTGVNDMTLGMDQAGTPGTATSDLAKLQESRGKFDFYFMNYKQFLNEIVTDVACNIHQFGAKEIELTDLDGEAQLNRFMQLPESYIRDGLIFDIKIVGQSDNKLVDRNNFMQLAQMTQQYYEAQLSLSAQLGDPALTQQIIRQGLAASTELMKQVLQTFEIRNIDRIIVTTTQNPPSLQTANVPSSGLITSGNTGGNQNPQGISQLQRISNAS